MRQDKNEAMELRRQGRTYREIEQLLKVSRSTLSEWFRNEGWSAHIKKLNTEKQRKISIENLKKMNLARQEKLEKTYRDAEQEAILEFELYKDNPLFMAGLMIYAGEGDKNNRFNVKLANSEFYLHLVFISFSEKFLKTERNNIKVWLLLYPDHNIEECLEIWSKKLRINRSNFNKSQVILGKSKLRKLQYGVGNSIISSTRLKKKVLKWLELCKLHFS